MRETWERVRGGESEVRKAGQGGEALPYLNGALQTISFTISVPGDKINSMALHLRPMRHSKALTGAGKCSQSKCKFMPEKK